MKKFFDYQSECFQVMYQNEFVLIAQKDTVPCDNKPSLIKQIDKLIKDLEALKQELKEDEKFDFLLKKHRNYYFNDEEYARKIKEN